MKKGNLSECIWQSYFLRQIVFWVGQVMVSLLTIGFLTGLSYIIVNLVCEDKHNTLLITIAVLTLLVLTFTRYNERELSGVRQALQGGGWRFFRGEWGATAGISTTIFVVFCIVDGGLVLLTKFARWFFVPAHFTWLDGIAGDILTMITLLIMAVIFITGVTYLGKALFDR